MTEYMVLGGGDGKWSNYGAYEANSAVGAIQAFLEQKPEAPEGEYVAVPQRSWSPVKVSREVQTKVRIV